MNRMKLSAMTFVVTAASSAVSLSGMEAGAQMAPASSKLVLHCPAMVDVIAGKMKYATFVDLSTVTNGITIAGERGGVMRDLKDGRKMIASFRDAQNDAKKACFITQ